MGDSPQYEEASLSPNALRRVLHRAQALLPRGRPGVTILGYHLVGGGTGSPVDLSLTVFSRQVRELCRLATVISLEQAVKNLADGAIQDGAWVVLTFDDAYENFYTTVWPVLEEHGVPATLFVPVGVVEKTIPPPIAGTGGLPPVSWRQLGEMARSGLLTVGSHTWSHCDLRRLPHDTAMRELVRSQRALEDRLATAVDCFCYPRGLWSHGTERLVAQVYRLATIGGGRRLTRQNLRPLRLSRVPMRRDMPDSIAPILRSPLRLEEWLADKVRRHVRRSRAQPAEHA